MIKLVFYYIVAAVSLILSVLHFLRLMFEKSIYFGEYSIPGWVSGVIVMFGIIMTYVAIRLSREQE